MFGWSESEATVTIGEAEPEERLQRVRPDVSESLLGRVGAGDPQAMRECVDRYGNLVWSLARRWSANLEEAEDASQEIFISLWRAAERYDPSVASEATYITMIARRRLIDRRRRLARRQEVDAGEDGLDDLPAEEVDLSTGSDAAVADRALSQLRPEQQRVLRLAIFNGLTHREISEQIGIPLGSVKTHARRGLLRLRESLRDRREADS